MKIFLLRITHHDDIDVHQDLFLYLDVLVYVEGVIYSMDEENERATQAGEASLNGPLQGLSKGSD